MLALVSAFWYEAEMSYEGVGDGQLDKMCFPQRYAISFSPTFAIPLHHSQKQFPYTIPSYHSHMQLPSSFRACNSHVPFARNAAI